MPQLRPTRTADGRRLLTWAILAAVGAGTLGGCQYKLSDGYLPHGITEGSERVRTLWVGAWIALIAVGLLVLGLTAWALVVYRHREGDDELPLQIRYNIPIEILYTVAPILMIVVFFFFTARDESALADTKTPADVTINVIGKQWSWDFNYVDANVHEAGTQAILTGKPGAEETIPTLYMPVGKRVNFVLTSRDVDHSFWVPVFLQKLDMIPGRVNTLQIKATETGTFIGKCAELCGAYHSQMLFNLKVVTPAEFDQHMSELKAAGQTGLLPNTLNREQIMPGQEYLLPSNARS